MPDTPKPDAPAPRQSILWTDENGDLRFDDRAEYYARQRRPNVQSVNDDGVDADNSTSRVW